MRALGHLVVGVSLGLALALAGLACSQSSHLGSFDGDTIPGPQRSLATGPGPQLGVGATSTATVTTVGLTQPGNPVYQQSGTLASDGSFHIGTSNSAGAFDLAVTGGTYIDPATGAAVNVSLTATGQSFLFLVARTSIDRGGSARVTISPLSTLAWALADGIVRVTGAAPEDAAARANRAVSLYFGANPNLVPFSRGQAVWDPGAPPPAPGLTDEAVIGLVTAGLSVRARALGTTLVELTQGLATDIADGVADGVSQPPLTSTTAAIGLLGRTPLGVTLAADIAAFLGSSENTSGITTATAQPLLDRLNAAGPRILGDAPLITAVASPVSPGSRIVTISGLDLDATASVFFDDHAGTNVLVASPTTLTADAPAAVAAGPVLVTVVNRAGFRHSFEATLTFP
jgi:hypothetical protein